MQILVADALLALDYSQCDGLSRRLAQPRSSRRKQLTPFFEKRNVVHAHELIGSRVYSTDLLPDLLNAEHPEDSVLVTARALKVKIITKGLVTLNGAHLVGPLSVLLLRDNPDLLEGGGFLPAVMADKYSLTEFLPESLESYHALGISDAELSRHIETVEGALGTVMPWDLGNTGEAFRNCLLAGIENPETLVSREMASTGIYDGATKVALEASLRKLDMTRSANLRDLIDRGVPEPLKLSFRRFAAACYHGIGTSVVRSETGTDLNPLSHFKAGDIVLVGRDAPNARLTEEAVFLRFFLAAALDAIQAGSLLPTEIIDRLSFRKVHELSAALREHGFRERYERVIQEFIRTASMPDPGEALESLDDTMVAGVARELSDAFRQAVGAELPNYDTREYELERQELVDAGTDIALDAAGMVPAIQTVVSAYNLAKGAGKAIGAASRAWGAADNAAAFAAALRRRDDETSALIRQLRIGENKRASLLDTAALLADIYGVTTRRG